MSAHRTAVALAALAFAVGACGATDGSGVSSLPPSTPVPTIGGVGQLPDTVPVDRQPIVRVARPVNDDGTTADLVGEVARGNRFLIIGDSIITSTSSRYGNQMCDALVPLGWQVEVEAEPSRFIDFGNKVLDKLLPDTPGGDDDWDAAMVFLGSNYRLDQQSYESQLREILTRLEPRPTLLFTVTEYKPQWAEVDEVVRELGAEFDNVTIVDWQKIAETPGVIGGDRLHPTEAGRQVLADAVATALGPGRLGDGACLKSMFTDDSAVQGNGSVLGPSRSSSRSGRSSSGSSSSGSSGSSGSTSSGSGSGSSGSGSTGSATSSSSATTGTSGSGGSSSAGSASGGSGGGSTIPSTPGGTGSTGGGGSSGDTGSTGGSDTSGDSGSSGAGTTGSGDSSTGSTGSSGSSGDGSGGSGSTSAGSDTTTGAGSGGSVTGSSSSGSSTGGSSTSGSSTSATSGSSSSSGGGGGSTGAASGGSASGGSASGGSGSGGSATTLP